MGTFTSAQLQLPHHLDVLLQDADGALDLAVDSVCIVTRRSATDPFRVRYRICLGSDPTHAEVPPLPQLSQTYVATVGGLGDAVEVYPQACADDKIEARAQPLEARSVSAQRSSKQGA